MATVRELVNVTRRALNTHSQVYQLERMAGAPAEEADIRAHNAAIREAVQKLCELLEADPCDL